MPSVSHDANLHFQTRGWPAAPRDHPRPWQPRTEERCWHKAVPPRVTVGPCLASVAPPRRQGGLRSFPALSDRPPPERRPKSGTQRQPRSHAGAGGTPIGGATGTPVLGRGGLRSACRTGRACASLGHGVGHISLSAGDPDSSVPNAIFSLDCTSGARSDGTLTLSAPAATSASSSSICSAVPSVTSDVALTSPICRRPEL
jgi:hypothetical protein